MNKDVEAPCKACGGLLPLKTIQTRRRGRHRRSCSLHPEQKQPGQGREKSRAKSSHRRQHEQGSTSQSKETRESTRSCQFSSSSDGQAEETSSRNRVNYELGEQFQAAKPAVLEQYRAAFASQKAKKELTRCGIHRDQELSSEQKPNSPSQQAGNQEKTLIPGDLDLPWHLHQHGAQSHNESTCTRAHLCHLPQEDASNSSSNPSVSTSLCKVRHVATQMSCKRLLAASKQTRSRDVQAEATAAISSQSGSASAKTYNRVHEAPEYHHNEECRSRAISPYPEVIHLYEECLVHHVEEHITASQGSSSRDSRKLQRRGNHPEQRLHTQPQVIFTCHQSAVHHHEVCHLHQDDDHDLPAAQSPMSRDPTTLCGLPEPAKNGFPPDARKPSHHSPTAYVKIESLCAQMITPRSGATSPCILHGDCESESCGTYWHPKADHIDERSRETPGELHRSSTKGKIHGCHLHRERPPSNPDFRRPQDPFVWTPRPTRTPSTPVRWMDRMIASQTIPPQIVREFLRGRRGWPPGAMKQKCLGCRKKQTDEENSPRDPCEFDLTSLINPGSSVAQSALECAKNVHHDENITRLLMARTQIIKPVVKLSTSKEVWRSRRELQFCSECWNPTKFGRWASILDEMSKDVSEVADTSRCDTKFSSCTAHGNPNPCDTGSVNLHRPELFSTFQLRLQAQKLQNETFDRSKALQVAQRKCIKLDKKVLAHVPVKDSPPRVDRAKQESPSLRRCHDAIAQKRPEPYVGFSKIVQPPNPMCRVERPPREVGKSGKSGKCSNEATETYAKTR